jgi:trigger factor
MVKKDNKSEDKEIKNSYLVDTKELSKVSKELTFKIPAKEFDIFYKESLENLSKDLKISGFRKGKVPADVAEKELTMERVLYNAGDIAVRKVYVDTIIAENISAIGEPKMDLKNIKKGEDLEFIATVDLLPEVELKSYKKDIDKINKSFADKKPEVTEESVQSELDVLAAQKVKIVTVNREAQKDDQVEVDFDVFVNNVAIEGGSAKKHPVIIGDGKFIPGFEDKMIGVVADDEKEFELTFPKEYHAKHLAGKKAKFKVKVNLVQERELPKFDDEFAKGFGKFKTMKELKDNLKHGLEHEQIHRIEDEWKKELIEALIEKTDMDIPKSLIVSEMDVMMRELENDVAKMGMQKEQYFQQVKVTEDKIRGEWEKKQAPNRVKAALILKELAGSNKLEPAKEDIQVKVDQIIQQQTAYGQDPAKLDIQRIYEAVKGGLTNEEVFKWLMGGEKNVHKCESSN